MMEEIVIEEGKRRSISIKNRPRIRIIAEEGSQVDIIEEQSGSQVMFELEIVGKPGSKVNYTSIQDLPESSDVKITRKAFLGKDAQLQWSIYSFGSGKLEESTDTYLESEGCQTNYSEIFFTNKKQDYNITSNLHHKERNTKGEVLVKGLLKNSSRAIFKGLIKIDKKAQQSDSFLAEHTMLLDKEARSDSIPALEIEANDVRCTHSSSMTQVDEEQVFYLQSRGINREEAREQIVLGFLNPVISKIAAQKIRENIISRISDKWHQ
jgi:Fe-S cluster assembly scaffold protein SufB